MFCFLIVSFKKTSVFLARETSRTSAYSPMGRPRTDWPVHPQHIVIFSFLKIPSFPSSTAGKRGSVFSCLCEVCRPLCPPGQCFTCSPSQGDGRKMLQPQGDQRAARMGWSSISLSSEYIVCDSEPFLKVKKGSNHCRKSPWR